MSSIPESSLILDPDDSRDLQANGLASSARDGMIRLHKRRLNPFSDQEYHHLPLPSPAASLAASNPPDPDDKAFVLIPEYLFSPATLQYIGFTQEYSTEIWSSWMGRPAHNNNNGRETDDRQVSFLSFVTEYICARAGEDVYGDQDEDDQAAWRATMDRCGINEELQEAIMDPRDKEIRWTQSCLFWVLDSVAMRFRGLELIQETSRARTGEQVTTSSGTQPSSSSSM